MDKFDMAQTDKEMLNKFSFKNAILKEAEKWGTVEISGGIVYVTMLNGDVWDFTVPMKQNR